MCPEDSPPEDSPPEDPVRVDVSVRFPDQHMVRYSFDREDTLETLCDTLRVSGQLFRTDDVILRGHSLIGDPDSRLRTLADCGVQDGDELLVKSDLPRQVCVCIPSIPKISTVTVGRGENCWREMRPKLGLPVALASCVLLQYRLFYRRQGKWRTALSDSLQPHSYYRDEEDGQEADAGVESHLVREFLTPDQGMRAAPQGTPNLHVLHEVVGVTDGQVCILHSSALFDHRFVALIKAFCCSPNRGPKKLCLQTCSGFFEASSGKTFNGLHDILTFARGQDMSVSESVLLLREGDVLPFWSLPRDKNIAVSRREGVELEIKDRRLLRPFSTALQPNVSQWTSPKEADSFLEEFSDTVRKLKCCCFP